jgi:dihydrofolate reductase
MSKVRVCCYTISLDGYGAGADQTLEAPMGVGGENLHGWMIATRTFQAMMGEGEGSTGVDDDFTAKGFENVGAWILGRNMFGPVRGDWPDETWQGWWGEEPPYHCDVYVLTHYPRASFQMKGGTTFHFVTEGPVAALQLAKAAAGGKDVRVGGGAETIRQYLRSRQIDEMHVAISPVLLGRGEALFEGIDLPALGYSVAEHLPGTKATHVVFRKDA